LDFLLFDQEMANKKRQVWLALVMPLLYMVFFFTAYAKTGQLPVLYFFLDFQTYGWFSIEPGGIGVVYWILILSLILLGIASLTQKLQVACRKRPWAVSVGVIVVMLGLPLVLTMLSLLIRR
jgi:nicotinamide riboside transporter PnuC